MDALQLYQIKKYYGVTTRTALLMRSVWAIAEISQTNKKPAVNASKMFENNWLNKEIISQNA